VVLLLKELKLYRALSSRSVEPDKPECPTPGKPAAMSHIFDQLPKYLAPGRLGAHAYSHMIEVLLKDLDRLKREVRQQVEQQHRLKLMRRQRAFKDLDEVLTTWKDKTDQLLTERSRQRILLDAHGLNAVNGLGDVQSHQALPLYEQAMQGFVELQKKWEKAVKLHDSLSLTPPMSGQRHPPGAASMQAPPAPANSAVNDSQQSLRRLPALGMPSDSVAVELQLMPNRSLVDDNPPTLVAVSDPPTREVRIYKP
jgi:hypothetical protein